MGDSKRESRASTLFVEDSLLFVVTFPLLVYFLDVQPGILLLATHALSIPCAGLTHGTSHERDHFVALFVSLACILTILSDAGVALFCSCQVFRFDFCCDFLRAFGVGCPDAATLPTVFFLFPVSLYNLACGIGRASSILAFASPSSRDIFQTAFIVVSYAAYSVLLLTPDNDAPSNLLVLLVCYATLAVVGSFVFLAIEPSLGTSVAFFPTVFILTLQTFLSLRGRYPAVYGVFPLCGYALCLNSAFRSVPGDDAWSRTYAWIASSVGVVVFVNSFDDLSPSSGAAYAAYFCSFATRVFFFSLDSHYASLTLSVAFCLFDVAFASYAIWWLRDAPHLFWVLGLCVSSLCVATATLVSRVYDIKQVEDDLRRKLATVVEVERVDVSSEAVDAEKVLNAFRSGLVAGKRVRLELLEGRVDPRDYDAFLRIVQEDDPTRISDPSAVRTTRGRIYFVKGVVTEMFDAVDVERRDALVNKLLWTLGVPRRHFRSASPIVGSDCGETVNDDGLNGLDVGWAPGSDDDATHRLSLSRLMALRSRAASEARVPRGEDLQRRVERRYRFVAGTVSFKTADKMARYERQWDIVWS